MTADGVAPDLDCHRIPTEPTRSLADGLGLADPSTHGRTVTNAGIDRMWRVRIALHQVQDELLRVHASTVLAMGQLGCDHARMTDALAEARSQHEALFLVGRAVDALMTPARRAGS